MKRGFQVICKLKERLFFIPVLLVLPFLFQTSSSKKKEAKPFVDKYSIMKSDDLLGILKSHHEDSDDGRKKRDSIEADRVAGLRAVEDVQNKYLLDKRGEHKKHKGKPKSHKLKGKEEATELLYKVALEGVRQEHGDAGVKLYKSDPHKLIAYIDGKMAGTGVDFYSLRDAIVRRDGKFHDMKEFDVLKQKMVHIDDLVELEHARKTLSIDRDHFEAVQKAVNGYAKKQGVELRKTTKQHEAVAHYIAGLGGELTGDYVAEHKSHFKKKPKG